MKTMLVVVVAGCFALTGFLIWDSHRPHGLPHRPITSLTNWGQGRVPESNLCPLGTIRFETDNGLFLECYRSSNR